MKACKESERQAARFWIATLTATNFFEYRERIDRLLQEYADQTLSPAEALEQLRLARARLQECDRSLWALAV